MTRTLGVIGTGMMGTSIALRAREAGWLTLGYDARPDHARKAHEIGAIQTIAEHPDEVYSVANAVVLGAHLHGTLAELQRLRVRAEDGAVLPDLIIDIASVKVPVCRRAGGIPNFVATHPLAGREHSGPAQASTAIFEGRPWTYVPAGAPGLLDRTREFIRSLGAVPVPIDAEQHDRTVALTSHLPQVLSVLFASRLEEYGEPETIASLSGPTARELKRLSHSSIGMWGAILEANAEPVAREARAFAQRLLRVADALENGDAAEIERYFTRAR
ncbi:MAG: prephenate dehydrogenase [Vulcanimicrobiaceae bacterium]